MYSGRPHVLQRAADRRDTPRALDSLLALRQIHTAPGQAASAGVPLAGMAQPPIDQFAAGLASILSRGQQTALQILGASPGGLSLIEWQTALGSNPGTCFPQRDRLQQLELIARDSQERGSPCRLTEDGKAVLAALKP